jgi:hypothetical protein
LACLKILLWWQSATLQVTGGLPPKVHRGSALPTVPDNRRGPVPMLKSESVRFPTEGRKTVTCYSVGSTRRPASPRCTEAQRFPWHLPAGESHLLCKSWNPSSSTEWYSATLGVPGSLTPTVHRCPVLPLLPQENPYSPFKAGTPALSLREGKK